MLVLHKLPPTKCGCSFSVGATCGKLEDIINTSIGSI